MQQADEKVVNARDSPVGSTPMESVISGGCARAPNVRVSLLVEKKDHFVPCNYNSTVLRVGQPEPVTGGSVAKDTDKARDSLPVEKKDKNTVSKDTGKIRDSLPAKKKDNRSEQQRRNDKLDCCIDQLKTDKQRNNDNAKRRHKEAENNKMQKKTNDIRNDKSAALVEAVDNSRDVPKPVVVPPPQHIEHPVEPPYDFGTYKQVEIYIRGREKTFSESWFDVYGGWYTLMYDIFLVVPLLLFIVLVLYENTQYVWCWQIYLTVYNILHLHFNLYMAITLVPITCMYPFLVECGVPHLNIITTVVLVFFTRTVDPYVVPPGYAPIITLPHETRSLHMALKHTHYKNVRVSEKILKYLLDELSNLSDRATIINTALHKVKDKFKQHSIQERLDTVYHFKNLLTIKQFEDDSFVSSGKGMSSS